MIVYFTVVQGCLSRWLHRWRIARFYTSGSIHAYPGQFQYARNAAAIPPIQAGSASPARLRLGITLTLTGVYLPPRRRHRSRLLEWEIQIENYFPPSFLLRSQMKPHSKQLM